MMTQCPICQAQYPNRDINRCFVCEWDFTSPHTLSSRVPAAFLKQERAHLSWARDMWNQHQTQLEELKALQAQIEQLNQEKVQSMIQEPVVNQLKEIEQTQADVFDAISELNARLSKVQEALRLERAERLNLEGWVSQAHDHLQKANQERDEIKNQLEAIASALQKLQQYLPATSYVSLHNHTDHEPDLQWQQLEAQISELQEELKTAIEDRQELKLQIAAIELFLTTLEYPLQPNISPPEEPSESHDQKTNESQLMAQLAQIEQELKKANQERNELKTQIKAIESLFATLQHKLPSSVPPLPASISLSSENGIDYTRLCDLLIAGNWKEADEETGRIILKVTSREEKGWIDSDAISRFPCTELRRIDQLWVHYSNGRFGFSVQKSIYEAVGKDFSEFGDRIGWRKEGQWVYYSHLIFNLSAPNGHLPSLRVFGNRVRALLYSSIAHQFVIALLKLLFNRAEVCQL